MKPSHEAGAARPAGAGGPGCALPGLYLITPQVGDDHAGFLAALRQSLRAQPPGALLVQLRCHALERSRWLALAGEVLRCCLEREAPLLLGAGAWPDPDAARALRFGRELGARGWHLPSRLLEHPAWRDACLARPPGVMVAASCHDARQLDLAARLGADFATLSPVLPTSSHPGVPSLGWEGLRGLCRQARLPVYALGGLEPRHLALARAAGAAGLAAIRGLWGEPGAGGDAAGAAREGSTA